LIKRGGRNRSQESRDFSHHVGGGKEKYQKKWPIVRGTGNPVPAVQKKKRKSPPAKGNSGRVTKRYRRGKKPVRRTGGLSGKKPGRFAGEGKEKTGGDVLCWA